MISGNSYRIKRQGVLPAPIEAMGGRTLPAPRTPGAGAKAGDEGDILVDGCGSKTYNQPNLRQVLSLREVWLRPFAA